MSFPSHPHFLSRPPQTRARTDRPHQSPLFQGMHSNPYHGCSEYCFKIIARVKKRMNRNNAELVESYVGDAHTNSIATSDEGEDLHDKKEADNNSTREGSTDTEEKVAADITNLIGRQKK